ncbi:NADH-quinone oxidoreductase subunit F [Planctomycetales bacterium]|nr:NADH-quinone oxidoreductase subunit F [Planctomycetales bacterium]
MLTSILEKNGTTPSALIPILQDIQRQYRYLPREILRELAQRTNITAADIYSVATFYDQFRLESVGAHIISVCTGTACHVKGSDRVLEAFRTTLKISENNDTSPDKQYTIQKISCLGCCTLAPVVQIDGITYGHLTAASVPDVLRQHAELQERFASSAYAKPNPSKWFATSDSTVKVGLGSCCQAQNSKQVFEEVQRIIAECGLDVKAEPTGCIGMCHQTPLLEITTQNGVSAYYCKVQPGDVRSILLKHFRAKSVWQRFGHRLNRIVENLWSDEYPDAAAQRQLNVKEGDAESFLKPQVHCATQYGGEINPVSLDDYLAHGGFEAWKRVQNFDAQEMIRELEQSGLRGRGGAGFPTASKWKAVLQRCQEPDQNIQSYVVCNADEGDPGAFMDRMILESYPYRVIEGMLIAAKLIGASQCVFYIRAEYPLAVERVRNAIQQIAERSAELSVGAYPLLVTQGSGAFVCGEETALLESIEGRRGTPRLKPPFPAQSGLFGQPTLINNVETFACVPYIFRNSAAEFAKYGTAASKGTKVFALAGKIPRGGLIEIPMGTPLRRIVEDIGGATAAATIKTTPRPKQPKAIQIGGPSGGCIPMEFADISIDYESLSEAGAMMGSGGLIVLDEDDCMVDMARYFLTFTQQQSCGKCTFCRIGTRRMLDILERLCNGGGQSGDIEKLEELAHQIKSGSLCGLGKTAPNPVLSTLRYFRGEYESHIEKRCPAGKCSALTQYRVTDECNGCSLCVRQCPVGAIVAEPYRKHHIDLSKCTKCDACRQGCPRHAIVRESVVAAHSV